MSITAMKKKHPEHVNLERWLVSYADFITLLFAFFVVMYAIANQDKAKVKQITDAIEQAFHGKSTPVPVNPFPPTGTQGPFVTGGNAPELSPELTKIGERIAESLAFQLQHTDLKDTLRVLSDTRGLVIRISVHKFFKPGKTEVNKEYLPSLAKIASILSTTDRVLRVEGHTDDRQPASFDTNWELSSAQAAWVVRFLSAKAGIPEKRLSVAGFAGGRPLTKNDSEEAREENRRVEIVVTNEVAR